MIKILAVFETGNNKKYKMKAIYNSTVDAKEADRHLLRLYYLVVWRGYLEEENIWELFLAVIHLWKMVNIFHKEHLEKPTATSASQDSALPIEKPIIKFFVKWKRRCPAKGAIKRVKWDEKDFN